MITMAVRSRLFRFGLIALLLTGTAGQFTVDDCQLIGKAILDCSNKGFVQVPSNISSDIRILRLQNNAITELLEVDFANLNQLVTLQLQNNSIDRIQTGVLDVLEATTKTRPLRELDMEDNPTVCNLVSAGPVFRIQCECAVATTYTAPINDSDTGRYCIRVTTTVLPTDSTSADNLITTTAKVMSTTTTLDVSTDNVKGLSSEDVIAVVIGAITILLVLAVVVFCCGCEEAASKDQSPSREQHMTNPSFPLDVLPTSPRAQINESVLSNTQQFGDDWAVLENALNSEEEEEEEEDITNVLRYKEETR